MDAISANQRAWGVPRLQMSGRALFGQGQMAKQRTDRAGTGDLGMADGFRLLPRTGGIADLRIVRSA